MIPNLRSLLARLFFSFFLLSAASLVFAPTGCAKTHEAHGRWVCPMHPDVQRDHPDKCPKCGMDLVPAPKPAASNAGSGGTRKSATMPSWFCPMHPHITAEKAEKCPICGMDLVENRAASASDEPTGVVGKVNVTLDARKIQQINLTTEVVAKRTLSKRVRASGVISHDVELYNAQQEHLSALRFFWQSPAEARSGAEALVQASRLKLTLMGWTPEQIGALASRGSGDAGLLSSSHHGSAFVKAQIFPRDLPFVRVGSEAEVTIPSLGTKLKGVVRSVNAVLDAETRTATARIEIPEAGAVAHEMYVSVIILSAPAERLSIPESAVIDGGEHRIVFVARDGGVLEPREVMLGDLLGDWYVVNGGVMEGERVATGALFLIDSESGLQAALKTFTSAGSDAKGGKP